MFPITLTEEARQERDAQAIWYELNSSGLGLRFVDTVEAAFELLAANPLRGRPFGMTAHRSLLLIRPFQRFEIIYLPRETDCLVVAVWSQRRNPDKLSRRL
jgi:plasmid stabilization system protein ParE